MEISVGLGEGGVVEATLEGHIIRTDQPVKEGGGGTAPSPFDLFMVSLATCAGYYVLDFCRTRSIPTAGVTVEMRTTRDPKSRLFKEIAMEIRLPSSFPEKYEKAVVKAANLCSVKKHIEQGLTINTFSKRQAV